MIIPPTPSPDSNQQSIPGSGTFVISTYLLAVSSAPQKSSTDTAQHQLITEHGIYSTAADDRSAHRSPPQSRRPISLIIDDGEVISWDQ